MKIKEVSINSNEFEYNGVKYTLVNPPTVVREGMVSDNSTNKGMTKYSLVFYHPMYMLGNFPFTDVAVSSDQNKFLSQNKKFSWMGTGFDLIDKLNKNLEGTQWFVVASDDVESRAKLALFPSQIQANGKEQTEKQDVLTFDEQYISDVLKVFYDNWKTPFVIDKIEEGEYYFTNGQGQRIDWYSQAGGNKRFVIVFGLPSNQILDGSGNEFVFQFGKNVGLKNNSRTQKNNKIITRIAGYGSENNIPYGYPQIQWYGNQSWDYTIDNNPNDPNSYPIYRGIVNGQYVKLIKHPFTRSALMPTVYVNSVFNKVSRYAPRDIASEPIALNTNYDPDTEIVDYYDAVDDATHTYPNNIVQNAPSFEIHQFENIKPELTSEQIVAISAYDDNEKNSITVQQFTAFMNAEIAAYDDITARYLTEMLNAFNVTPHTNTQRGFTGGSYTYEWSLTFDGNYCKAFYNSPVTMFQKTVKVANAAVDWDDSMDNDGNYKQSYFKITLPQLGFDLYACAAITEEMEINMRSGACMGCTFAVQVDWDDYKKNFYDSNGDFAPNGSQRDLTKYPKSNLGQITVVVAKDIDTFGTILPDSYRQPSGGDEFVILGISLPLSYVTSAQTRLDEAMKEYMLENNVYYYDYPLKFDEYFLATHESILAQMRNNSVVAFVYGNEPTKKLYIKQITVKYGDKPLPTYDITITDDVEIVLNQIGQVTDDVSRVRLQMSELQKYYGINLSNLIEEKLSRVSDDVAKGRITFQQGLDAIGRVIFSDEIKSNGFVQGMTDQGRGWRIDAQGNAEFESLRCRSYLEVIELLINRLQAQEGDTLFTDNDQIIYVEQKTYNSSTYYKLTLKEKWEGYTTCQKNGNVIKGIINTLAANAGNVSDVTPQQSVETDGDNKYYTSWMRVVDPSNFGDTNGTNQICVVLYSDSDTPANKNFPPCELMNIARWGCALNPNEQGISASEKADRKRRQNLFMISTSDGRLVKLNGVNTPKLSNGNYGTTLGELPDFVKAYPAVAQRLVDGGDYLYAQGIVVGDFIKIDVDGVPVVNYVDQGEWQDNTTYLCNEYNSTTKQYETHDVWHNNALWRCLQHEPVTVGGVTTYYEPTEQNSAYWQMLMEGSAGAKGDDLRENIVDGNNTAYTVDLSQDTQGTNRYFTTDKSIVIALLPSDGTKMSGQVRLTLTDCSVNADARVQVYFQTQGTNRYPIIGSVNIPQASPDGVYDIKNEGFVLDSNSGQWEAPVYLFIQNFNSAGTVTVERVKLEIGDDCSAYSLSENDKKGTSVSKTGADTYRYAVSASGSTTPSTWYATKQAAIDAYTGTTGGTWPKNTFMWTETTIHWNTGNTILYNAERNPSDGTNAFVVDLDPQMTSVALQDGDLVDDVDLYFYPRAYYGSTSVINDCTIDASATDPDFTITADNTNHRVRVQIPQGTGLLASNEVTCTVTHSTYGSRTVKFILAGVESGDDGSPAVLQEITPSRSVISFARQANGTLTPSSRNLTLQIKKTVGDVCTTETISQSGLTVRYSFSSMPSSSNSGTAWGTSDGTSGTSWSSNTLSIQSSIDVTNLYIAAFNSSGTLVDMETIPIVKDGDNGNNGDDAIEYTVKTSVDNISIPSNEISATLSATATFYKKEGQNAEVAYYGYYGIYQRSGNSYTRIAYNSTSASTYSISTEVTSAIDAIVIFLFSSKYSGSSPDTQAYLAKKEIVVNKKTDNVNPNILLRTVFDRGINPVKEIWWSGSWSYVGVEITNFNLLDGRRSLVIDGQSYGSDLDLSQNVYQKVKTSTWYTLSFYAKANASYNTFIYSGSSSYACIDVNAGIYIDGVFQSGSAPQDGVVSWPSSGSFVRHTVTFKTKSTFNTTQVNIMFRASSSCKLYLCMPKLENGKVGTAYMAHESDLVGDEGVKGDAGRMYYYADVWDATNTTKTFTANDAQTPFFKVGSSYYVYVGSENFTDQTMYWINSNPNIGAPSSSNNKWQIMVNDFKYLITNAIFGDYAQFGANIINGDYRFSQYGYMRGFEELKAAITDSTQYQNCDPDDMFGEDDFFDQAKMLVNTTFDSYTEIADDATTNSRYTIIGNMIEFAQSSSPSSGSIRNIWTGGYTYFRYKDSETAITYSSWIYMQSGNNYYFAVGSSATTAPSSGWSTYPPTQTAQTPYLWLRIVNGGRFTHKRVSSKIPSFSISYGKWYAIELEMAYDSVFSDNRPVNINVGNQSSQITVGSAYYKEVQYSYNGTERVRVCLLFKCEVSGGISNCNLWTNQPHKIYAAFLRESQFVPYLCEDLLQGKVVFNNVVARGELHSESLYYGVKNGKGLVVQDESIITLGYSDLNAMVTLPTPSEAKGRVIEIYSGINQFDENNSPISPVFKLGYTGATSNTHFRTLTMTSSYYRQANFQNWPESYLKLWSNGTYWYVIKAEKTLYDSTNHSFTIQLLTKAVPNGL